MSRNRLDHLPCSLARALDEAGDWWTFLIVRDLLRGINSFDGFQSSLGIASNILSRRLVKLCDDGILSKRKDASDGRRMRYALTPKGEALAPSLIALMQWGDEWISGRGREPVILADKRTGGQLEPIRIRADGADVPAGEIEFRRGPGLA
ncbi:helix-turn-helix domain-containing protein [Bradyrhizobium sp. Leo170]|uniref:winged helix-turn-helix transcriptional regulator n=1 Tax=Bradyrhizobium sp. Leo170 TaxID=1571199 RepID=UPI00102E72BF|nr:helix-turn-helix domain-containing protein [Bradyrhizobium sp. Leo170]TAI63781.1 transcriptional regulator [Bradyrhizobium sp. Leo170]